MIFFKHLFTDATNKNYDYTKVLGGIAFVAFLMISCWYYGLYRHDWSPMEWSSSIMVLIGGAGGVSKIKDFTSITKE